MDMRHNSVGRKAGVLSTVERLFPSQRLLMYNGHTGGGEGGQESCTL